MLMELLIIKHFFLKSDVENTNKERHINQEINILVNKKRKVLECNLLADVVTGRPRGKQPKW